MHALISLNEQLTDFNGMPYGTYRKMFCMALANVHKVEDTEKFVSYDLGIRLSKGESDVLVITELECKTLKKAIKQVDFIAAIDVPLTKAIMIDYVAPEQPESSQELPVTVDEANNSTTNSEGENKPLEANDSTVPQPQQ